MILSLATTLVANKTASRTLILIRIIVLLRSGALCRRATGGECESDQFQESWDNTHPCCLRRVRDCDCYSGVCPGNTRGLEPQAHHLLESRNARRSGGEWHARRVE